jgi:predicted nicotinamide N-methyase
LEPYLLLFTALHMATFTAFPAFGNHAWEETMFGDNAEPEVGQRLGIQYMRTLQTSIGVKYGDDELQFHQEGMGMMAISGVVWDAGLLMVDFLWQLSRHKDGNLGKTLDIGCGTGIAGISALVVGAERVLFTDVARLGCFDLNIEQLQPHQLERLEFESYLWNESSIPECFVATPLLSGGSTEGSNIETSAATAPAEDGPVGKVITWDTVLCSDLLYEQKSHAALLSVLRRIHFRRAVFSYKKRHDAAERAFFAALSEWCTVRVVDSACIPLVNLPRSSLAGLFIVIVEPRIAVDSETLH